MYKTFVIDYNPQADKMARAVEKRANEVALDGFKVLSFSITGSGKAVLLAEGEDEEEKEPEMQEQEG